MSRLGLDPSFLMSRNSRVNPKETIFCLICASGLGRPKRGGEARSGLAGPSGAANICGALTLAQMRHKGRSTPAAKPVAFRTFGEIRPLMWKWVLPVYGDPDAPPFEIVCETREAAETVRRKAIEFDRADFERRS